MILDRLFRREPPPRPAATLYAAVVARGRAPHWYVAGAVPDTIDGRFDMIAAVLAVVMLRLEREAAAAASAAGLAECFVDDMDGQLRQIGFGDMVVGKHIGRMMAMLGGRIGAYREGLTEGGTGPLPHPATHASILMGGGVGERAGAAPTQTNHTLEAALVRNLYRGADPGAAALGHVAGALRAFHAALAPVPLDRLLAGDLPR